MSDNQDPTTPGSASGHPVLSTSGAAYWSWAGGPAGRHAGAEWLLGVGPLLFAACLPVVVAVLRLSWCLGNGWQGARPIYRMCYTDLANSVQGADLSRGLGAFLSGSMPLDQPPLSGLAMATLGGLTSGPLLTQQRWFLALWAGLALSILLVLTLRIRAVELPQRAVVLMALSPVTALTVMLSPDILGVGLATGGLLAWSAKRGMLAGVLVGAATLARSYPMVIVALILLLAVRTGDAQVRRRAVRFVLAFVGTCVAVLGVLFWGHLDIALRAWKTWWLANPGLGSPWYLPTLGEAPLAASVAGTLAIAGWVVALLAGGWVLWHGPLAVGPPRARRQAPVAADLAAATLVVVALVLITGKSFPIQSSLWLVPLVALAGLKWRDVVIWWAVEGAHFVALWLYVGGLSTPSKGLPAPWYVLFSVLRIAGVAWLAVCAASRRQEEDGYPAARRTPISADLTTRVP